MVESAATKPAEMCQRLQATHRWCVTGTPVQRDLNGMYSTCYSVDFSLVTQALTYMYVYVFFENHWLLLVYAFVLHYPSCSVYFCIVMFFPTAQLVDHTHIIQTHNLVPRLSPSYLCTCKYC